jgi:hypothetical protein
MIERNKEGFYFISKRGIKYDLYEGVTMGGERQYTSDAIIIMLSEVRDDVDSMLVDFVMGASFLEEELDYFNRWIGDLVEEYETRNNLKGDEQ